MLLRSACALLMTLGLLPAMPARAADDINYTIKRGETLIQLADKYLVRPADYAKVQKANAIRNASAIPIGTVIRFPRSLLKFQAAQAKLVAVRGQVTTISAGRTANAQNGLTLGEGASVKTAGSSFATLSLEDGSRISLPSNSDLKIVRLRKYMLGSSLDYDFEVGRGGARSKVAPLKSSNDRYQVRTPKAVSAVRGTDFQTRYDDATSRDYAEVVEGGLAVGLGNAAATDLPAGNGLAVSADGSATREALMAAPQIEGAGKMQSNKSVLFALPQIAGSQAMRISIASDAGFVDQIADITAKGPTAEFPMLEDGNYFVRARAVSEAGIEGMPATYAFKRRMNSVAASAGAGADGWSFKWLTEGRGKMLYHFQLYRGSTDGPPMVDEAGLTAQQISLSDLPPSDYYWRVASVQYVDGEVSTNWTDFEKISVSAE
jgi:hypothetical protein